MRISKQARREATQLFHACQVADVLDEDRVRQMVQLVALRKPRGYVAILHHLRRLVQLDLERHTAKVESAIPLQANLEADFRGSLTHRHGPGLQFIFRENPALLAGARVQVGSDVYDGSVRARLRALEESF